MTKDQKSKQMIWYASRLVVALHGCTNRCCFRDTKGTVVTNAVCNCKDYVDQLLASIAELNEKEDE